MYGVSALTLSLVSPLDLNCVYLEVPCEVRDVSLNSLARCNMGYLPKLFLTVLETSTEMLDETNHGKQMARFCLSHTILFHLIIVALNMYSFIGSWKLKLGSFPFVLDSGIIILVLSLVLVTCLHAGLLWK